MTTKQLGVRTVAALPSDTKKHEPKRCPKHGVGPFDEIRPTRKRSHAGHAIRGPHDQGVKRHRNGRIILTRPPSTNNNSLPATHQDALSYSSFQMARMYFSRRSTVRSTVIFDPPKCCVCRTIVSAGGSSAGLPTLPPPAAHQSSMARMRSPHATKSRAGRLNRVTPAAGLIACKGAVSCSTKTFCGQSPAQLSSAPSSAWSASIAQVQPDSGPISSSACHRPC